MKKISFKELLKLILINSREGTRGKASKDLYKARYGKDWSKFYPASSR